VLAWLLGAAVGPAAVALPVNWAAAALADAAQRWFKRLRRTDDLSRLVKAAADRAVALNKAEFEAVRKLLEDQQTWTVLAHGTVEDLASRIASCLPLRDGRTAEDSQAAAVTIARGLLEFAVADLDPKLFQQVLLARLQRMETDQGSALDEAMLGLHADLIAGFADAIGQFKRVLDRLPPGPAQRGEIAVYLTALIGWLNVDPWPRDRRFGGPLLTPAAIERKLRVTTTGLAGERDVDADELAKLCQRLVMLGGPGSGKTWLAKRTARRCAEDALQALASGGSLDEVELPLYTTCSRLFTADGNIRAAAVSSSIDQIGDLGGSRIRAALQTFFTERNTPVMLVLDSLDEAPGSDERLRQADTLPWRIILTSRPSAWNQQLVIEAINGSGRVGELRPLRYPDDVGPFIQRWFDQRPDWGISLSAQIAQRPALQQGATVPLLLAFYCIVGGDERLPDFRRDLYPKVLNRMLTGRWRRSDGRQPDTEACLQTLRAWAWSGATSHPISGVGTWADDIPTEPSRLREADDDALNHIATPLGPPDVDTGKTVRRFIHRSIREHLVGEHISRLPADQAVEALLPHLWYDPDWEYAALAALRMHPQHDHVLRELICRVAHRKRLPGDLAVIDAEFLRLLVRLAGESSEAQWSPEVADVIGKARVEFAKRDRMDELAGTEHWRTSDRQAREVLLTMLAGETSGSAAAQLAGGVARLSPTAQDQRQARETLLTMLAGETSGWTAAQLASGVARLSPTAQDQRQARETLLTMLAGLADDWPTAPLENMMTQPGLMAENKMVAASAPFALMGYAMEADGLADGVIELNPTPRDMRQARDALVKMLANDNSGWATMSLPGVVARLAPTAQDQKQARDALLKLLARQTDGSAVTGLADAVARLNPTAEDTRQARDALLKLLARQTDGSAAARMPRAVARLNPTAEDTRQVRDALLKLLARQTDGSAVTGLADAVARLNPTAEDTRQARDALLKLLARQTDGSAAAALASAVARLDPAAQDARHACGALLKLLPHQTDGQTAVELADAVAQLDPTAQDAHHACGALLKLLPHQTDGRTAARLAGAVASLDSTTEHKHRARNALLELLAKQADGLGAAEIAGGLVRFGPTAENKRQVRERLFGFMAGQAGPVTEYLFRSVAQFDPTVHDLNVWHAWALSPTTELLGTVRRNSALADWIEALPTLTSFSG
jgi:hypothetical protein